MQSLNDNLQMHNGVSIPIVGFGTWKTPDDETGYQAVRKALEVGYRHIDTASVYDNEETVGRAMKDSGIPRENIFLTSKVWNNDHGYQATLDAFALSLKKLDTDYLDLYLIHWPNPIMFRDQWQKANAGSWRAMEELYAAKKIKAIGVSNFLPHHIEELLKTATIAPMVNQIRLCPGDSKEETVAYCRAHNMIIEAYSPLGTGLAFEVEELQTIAKKYNTSIAKVCLRWSLQNGFLPLPKSVTPERIIENADIFGFELSSEDMTIITNLTGRCGLWGDPDSATF